jgi:hypothetical protein
MPNIAVYLGPSLDRATAESILGATYLPPICRGDLARLPENITTVGIVDGEFYQSLAVSPKEILSLIDRGVSVFGASSMGALRAAETERFGMIGIGEIFALYRDGVLDGDDEVALTYEPDSYRKLSEPLVNIRRTLQMATVIGVITETERDRLILEMKTCYFPHRGYQALGCLCPALVSFFRDFPIPDIKRDDAKQLLLAIRELRSPVKQC